MLTVLALLLATCTLSPAGVVNSDICVYGGTSGGVTAAVAAARLGKSVALVVVNNHVGGMTSGGLGVTDLGNSASIGGLAAEFYSRVGQACSSTNPVYYFEPHLAENTFLQMLAAAGVPIYTNQQLASVTLSNLVITQITMVDGTIYRAKEFIDTTCEGDLMALAGVSNTVGREAEATYELLHRHINAYVATNGSVPLNVLIDVHTLIPNGKTDINAYAPISTDYIGCNFTCPTNTCAGRQLIYQQHKNYISGMLYYLANSTNVPVNVRTSMQSWGHAKDEFQDNGGWPLPNGPYLTDESTGQGSKYVTFTPNLATNGYYDVYLWWVFASNRATRVPVDIASATTTNRVSINEQLNVTNWYKIASSNYFTAGGSSVTIRNTSTSGYVVANAVRWMPLGAIAPQTTPLPLVEVVASYGPAGEFPTNSGRFTLTYTQAENTPDVALSFRWSPDLLPWFSGPGYFQTLGITDQVTNQLVQLQAAIPVPPNGFIRASATWLSSPP